MRKLLSLMFGLSLAMVANGEQIVFTPQWTAQAQFAGYYVAQAKGYYKDAGLDIRIDHPSASNPCFNKLKNGDCQIVTLQLFSALSLWQEGVPLLNVMQTSQQNMLMIVAHKPINGVESLRGLKIGHWAAGFSELPEMMNKYYNLGIEWIPFLQNVNLFVSGAIDATMAMSYNEYYQLVMAGQRLKPEQLIYFRDIGFNIPEDGVYVTPEFYASHRDEVDRFCEASRKGWLWCVEHPEEALDIVMEEVRHAHIGTNREMQRYLLQEILKGQEDMKTGERPFRLSEESLQLCERLMREYGYLDESIDPKKLIAR